MANEAFQRGFNMVMQMHGMKQRGQQVAQQKERFAKEHELNKRKTDLMEEAQKLQERVTKSRMEALGVETELGRMKMSGMKDLSRNLAFGMGADDTGLGQPPNMQQLGMMLMRAGETGAGVSLLGKTMEQTPEDKLRMAKDLAGYQSTLRVKEKVAGAGVDLQAKKQFNNFMYDMGYKETPEWAREQELESDKELAAYKEEIKDKMPTTPFQWFIKANPQADTTAVSQFMKNLKRPTPDKLRELDVVAQSVGIDPASLRNGSLTQPEADKIMTKLMQNRKWALMGAMLGLTGGTMSPGSTEGQAGDFIK